MPPAVREVDVDVAEVGLRADTRPVLQGGERLAAIEALPAQVAADLVVLASVPLLGDQPAVDLGRGVPLFARGRLIGGEDLVDERSERTEHRGGPRRPRPGRSRFRVLQGLEDRLGRVVQLVGDLPDGQPVATQLTDAGMLVHREHPCPPAAASSPHAGLCYGVSLFEADPVSRPEADYQPVGFAVRLVMPAGP